MVRLVSLYEFHTDELDLPPYIEAETVGDRDEDHMGLLLFEQLVEAPGGLEALSAWRAGDHSIFEEKIQRDIRMAAEEDTA